MGLVLVGPQSVRELRSLAVKNFAAVPPPGDYQNAQAERTFSRRT